MVESPAQSGRMRALIHRGPISRDHVTLIAPAPMKEVTSSQPPHLPQGMGSRNAIFCGDVREQGNGAALLAAHPQCRKPILPQSTGFFSSLLDGPR
jgi:hypothetical protein